MAEPAPWTSDLEARLRALHAEGKSLTACARELGLTKPRLSRKAADLGLDWDRSQTQAATAAHIADGKARRARLQLALLEDAERLREQLWAPATVFNFGGKDNTYEERVLDKPPFADQLKNMQATGVAIDRSLKLDVHDSGAGATVVVGLLQLSAAALGLNDGDDTAP